MGHSQALNALRRRMFTGALAFVADPCNSVRAAVRWGRDDVLGPYFSKRAENGKAKGGEFYHCFQDFASQWALKVETVVTDAPAGALLDWCDVRGVDLEAFVVRKAAGDRVVLDDRTSLLGDVLGARALLECVER